MAKQGENAAQAIFHTADEARATKPTNKWKLWMVLKDGKERFCWAGGKDHAMRVIAMADGYTARCLDTKPVNPAMVSGMLATLSAEDRAVILAQFSKKK
jgi:hypothetical protein